MSADGSGESIMPDCRLIRPAEQNGSDRYGIVSADYGERRDAIREGEQRRFPQPAQSTVGPEPIAKRFAGRAPTRLSYRRTAIPESHGKKR